MNALRRRFARVRDDSGQGLIVVVLMSMLIMGLVVTVTSITATNVVPARQAQDSAAALAAAQGGVDDFIAAINTNCLTAGACGWIAAGPTKGTTTLASGLTSFSWRITNAATYGADGFVRVESIGKTSSGSGASRTIVADINSSQLLDYLYYTRYETQSQAAVKAQYPAREVRLQAAPTTGYTAATSVANNSTVVWNGVSDAQTAICERFWYTSTSVGTGRSELRRTGGLSSPSMDGIDFAETGAANTPTGGRNAACEVAYTSGSILNGKVYSEDALLVSSSTAAGAGPVFGSTVETGWSRVATPPADPARTYRTYLTLPNSVPAKGTVTTATTSVALPGWTAPTTANCIYTGPTRVQVVGANVVVTSPLTAANSANPCFASKSGVTGPLIGAGASVVQATYPYAGKNIYIRDAAGTTSHVMAPQTGATVRTATNSIFRITEGSTAPGPTTSTTITAPDAAWTYTSCTLLCVPALTQLALETGHQYSAIQDAVQLALTTAPTGSTQTQLETLVKTTVEGQVNPGNQTGHHRYVVTVGSGAAVPGGVTSGTSTPLPTTITDPFFATTAGSTNPTTTVTNTPINVSVARECARSALGTCVLLPVTTPPTWINPVVQFTFAATASRATTTSAATSPSAAFPIPGDRTQYSTTTGDAYISGAVTGALSLSAENNVIVTDNLTHTDGVLHAGVGAEIPYFSSASAVSLVAKKNVLLYHPVSCKNTTQAALDATKITGTASTTLKDPIAAYCPDDLTGLYKGGIPSANFATVHPSRQYLNMRTATSRVDAAIFALEGSFALVNFDKAEALNTLQVDGAVYQQHRGATGIEWEITADAAGSRPMSGYKLDYRYDRGLTTKSFPYIPSAPGLATGRLWNLQGYSEKLN